MTSQFINLRPYEIDKPIYRILSFKHLVEMFESKRNTLLNPSKWNDKYENLFLNSTVEIQGLQLESELGKSIFCQCWSFTEESDTMWSAYSSDGKSVQISSTPRKLFSGLFQIHSEINKVFVGKVEYLTPEELKLLFKENGKELIFEQGGFGKCKTLLYKRSPFNHENEVRLIYNTERNMESLVLKYNIDPFHLIDNIIFDPKISNEDFKAKKWRLQTLGIKKNIIKSKLYESPTFNIIK